MWGMVRDYHVVYCVVYGALCGVGIVLWGCLLGCMGGVLCLWVNGFVGVVCDIVCVCVWGCDLRFTCGVGHIVCGVGFT